MQRHPKCLVAEAGTNILLAFTTRKHARQKVKSSTVHASLRPAETFMCACRRPTEAAHFRVQKCANNHQLIVASVQRFLQHACAAHFRVIHTPKMPYALRIYRQTLIGVFFMHGTVTCMPVLH